MILADASALIDFHRKPTEAARQLLTSGEVAICGVTRAEVMAGARTREHLTELAMAMDAFHQIPITAATWSHLGENLFVLLRRGMPLPFQDVLIATVALENDLAVWTHDAHFKTIQSALPALRLIEI